MILSLARHRAFRALIDARTLTLTRFQNHSSFTAKDNKHRPKIGQSEVFYQNGLKISELPLVVKKVNDVLNISGMDKFNEVLDLSNGSNLPESTNELSKGLNEEELEAVAGFRRCDTVKSVFDLLQTIPSEEVTPPVAVQALKRIIDLENSRNFRKPLANGDFPSKPATKNESFLRTAFINMLLDIVYRSRDPCVILEGLKIVSRDTFNADSGGYKERICEETLVCISEGIFSLKEVCEAVVVFSRFYEDKRKCYKLTDKLWSAILDKADEISAESISFVFATLPHLKKSRGIIQNVLDERIADFWQEYKVENVLEMLKVFTDLNYSSRKSLKVLSQWLLMNLHTVKEGELLAIIYCFHKLEYIDETIITTMEKYMKIRGCQIREKDLVASMCDYCLDFRVRSPDFLHGVSEFFIEYGKTLSPAHIYSITRIFGELNHHPTNGFKFWMVMEEVLEQNFSEFPPKEIINLLLSYVYIERYPLNFVPKYIKPVFLDRLLDQSDADVIASRRQLNLLDSAMTIDCQTYSGPHFLSFKKSKYQGPMLINQNILRLAKSLLHTFAEVVGDEERVEASVLLSSLPLHPLYVVDIMIYPSVSASLRRFGALTHNNQIIAVLFHPAEHTVRYSDDLIGSQVLRERLLKKLGFRVISLKVKDVTALKRDPVQLRQFIQQHYQAVLK